MTDAQYLTSIRPNATTDELWRFCERVAICMFDGGLSEDYARATALNWL
jgi:hypothetical protein